MEKEVRVSGLSTDEQNTFQSLGNKFLARARTLWMSVWIPHVPDRGGGKKNDGAFVPLAVCVQRGLVKFEFLGWRLIFFFGGRCKAGRV